MLGCSTEEATLDKTKPKYSKVEIDRAQQIDAILFIATLHGK